MANLRERLHAAIRALEAGDVGQAVRHATAAVAQAPQIAVAHLVLGRARLEAGASQEAARSLRRATVLDPRSAEAWASLGSALQAQGQVTEPLDCFERALALAPRAPAVLLRVGSFLLDRGELEDAESCFRAANTDGGTGGSAGLLAVFERRGALVEARVLVDASPALLGRDPLFTLAAARTLLRSDRAADALAALDRVPADRILPALRVGFEHARGDVLDALGDPDGAFRGHARANALRRLSFDSDAHSARVDALIAEWTAARFASSARAAVRADDAVLIVGMPRSGTTLVEQILASHPGVRTCGELNDLPAIERQLDFADAGSLDVAASRYLARLRRDGTALRVIDKLPVNFLSLHAAAALLPGARVVHVRRAPLDTCVSCFFKDLHATLAWTTDLRSLGRYYRDYFRLMAHWREALPLPLLDVVYERLVAEPEAEVRRVLEFLDLPWDPACLRYFERRPVARTASYAQVVRPIYRDSVGRAARYAGHLEPLLEALGDPEGAPKRVP